MPNCPNCQELYQELARIKRELQLQIDRNLQEFQKLADEIFESRRAATEILTQLYDLPQIVEMFQKKYPWIHAESNLFPSKSDQFDLNPPQ